MCKREPHKGFVIVSVELPIDVADLLSERQGDLITVIEALGRECGRLPPTSDARAEADRLREQKAQDRQAEIRKIGRSGYRLYRRRISTDGYINVHCEYRDRPARLSKAQWRCLVIAGIAEELGVSKTLMELAIPRFRNELHAKIKPRRNHAVTRLFNEGLSDREIADRINISITTIIRYRDANLDEIQKLPGCRKSLKKRKRGAASRDLTETFAGDRE